MEETRSVLSILPFLVPLFLLEIGLLVFALIDIIRRKKVTGGSKIVWIVIIVLIEIIGPIIYLMVGRKEEIIDSDKD
jgi:hypothetical protein